MEISGIPVRWTNANGREVRGEIKTSDGEGHGLAVSIDCDEIAWIDNRLAKPDWED